MGGNSSRSTTTRRMQNLLQTLSAENEQIWIRIANLNEMFQDTEEAAKAYENVLRHNRYNRKALIQIASIYRSNEHYAKAVEYLNRILELDGKSGEIWGELGHCYLMMDELQKAYTAYQNALCNLPNPKDPKLWYGIGILYDRYGSLDHAEEAFDAVLKIQPDFEKANEIHFRLGIIYKQLARYRSSLECFNKILNSPPAPLTQADIYFQIGHVCELQKDVRLIFFCFKFENSK